MTKRKTKATTAIQVTRMPGLLDARAKITPNCAEQGIANASRMVVITLSLTLSKVLVTMVAMVPHPNPRVMGMTALPESPIFLKSLSTSRERRGR